MLTQKTREVLFGLFSCLLLLGLFFFIFEMLYLVFDQSRSTGIENSALHSIAGLSNAFFFCGIVFAAFTSVEAFRRHRLRDDRSLHGHLVFHIIGMICILIYVVSGDMIIRTLSAIHLPIFPGDFIQRRWSPEKGARTAKLGLGCVLFLYYGIISFHALRKLEDVEY